MYPVFYSPFLPSVKPHRAAARSEPAVPHATSDSGLHHPGYLFTQLFLQQLAGRERLQQGTRAAKLALTTPSNACMLPTNRQAAVAGRSVGEISGKFNIAPIGRAYVGTIDGRCLRVLFFNSMEGGVSK
jgi:hypothetical protein